MEVDQDHCSEGCERTGLVERRRIVYIQYTNPAGYPPLEHSSRFLARHGWDVLFLGASARGADLLTIPLHPNINVRRLQSFGGTALQKVNYFVFIMWCVTTCLWHRPSWIYASDQMAAIPASILSGLLDVRTLYHEHDSPSYPRTPSLFQRLFRVARARLARKADIVVLPQQQRLEAFVADTRRSGPTLCIWNCPCLEEVREPREKARAGRPLRLYYHGSLNRDRLPPTLLDALAIGSSSATLTLVGYETIGSKGYIREFMAHAEQLGLGARVKCLGAISSRERILAEAAIADVGLSFMPIVSCDQNIRNMVGASNKPFDYLAAGLMLLVSELPDWEAMYVDPGYALACDPRDAQNLSHAIAWCEANPDRVRAMGEAGRQRILSEWNYERQFSRLANIFYNKRGRL